MARRTSSGWVLLALLCVLHGLWLSYKALAPEQETRVSNPFVRLSHSGLLRDFYFWSFAVASGLSGLAAIGLLTGDRLWVRLARYGACLALCCVAVAYAKTWYERKQQTLVKRMMAGSTYENIDFWLLWIAVYALGLLLLLALRRR